MSTDATHVDFVHQPHEWVEDRKKAKPVRTNDERVGFNGKIGLLITAVVGTMWCAYVFTGLAFVSFKAALDTHDLVTIVGWIAQTFLQLVLLPIIIVGQNLQSRAADKRSEQTYKDAEAILHECLQLQAHLQKQDQVLEGIIANLGKR